MLRVKIGLGNFSSLEVVGRGCPGPPPPCTACVCVVRRVAMSSQVGAPTAVLNAQPSTEHSSGVGGAIVGKVSKNFEKLVCLKFT